MDLSLLKKILQDEIPLSKIALIFDETLFIEEGRKVFDYIKKFYSEFNKLPKLDTVEKECDLSFDGINCQEPVEFYIKQLQHRRKMNRVGRFVQWASTTLSKELDPDKVLDSARELIKNLHFNEKSRPWDINVKQDRKAILDTYLELKDLKGKPQGIELPWPFLNEVTGGLTPGHFTSIISRSETGKTWITLKIAETAHRQGKNIIIVSPEMTADIVRYRLAAIYNRLSYSAFRKGFLDEEEEKRLIEFVESDVQNSMLIADAPVLQSVEQLDTMVADRRPDLVLVDSYFLLNLEHQRYGSTNERREATTIELYKQAKKYKIPYIITTHFTAKVTQEKKGEAEDVAYTKQVIRLVDLALGLYRDDDMSANNTMMMRFLKHREGMKADVMINFNLDFMDFNQIHVESVHGGEFGGNEAPEDQTTSTESSGGSMFDMGSQTDASQDSSMPPF